MQFDNEKRVHILFSVWRPYISHSPILENLTAQRSYLSQPSAAQLKRVARNRN